jgi:[acyl-carrier-protein] S-malonyltransferase
MMQPAADRMAEALASVTINAPAAPLVANVLASATTSPDEIRKLLVQQITGAVRWRESVAYMAANGVKTVYELGAGRVLTGLARRIDRNLDAKSVGSPSEIENFATTHASAS